VAGKSLFVSRQQDNKEKENLMIGRLAARAVIGGLFIGHGTQKLFGWFDGPGPEGTERMMGKIGMHPASRNAMAAGLTETAGGALLAVGLATPLAAASLIGVMITAIRKVHLDNGPWNTQGGYEYNLALIAAPLGLADAGPGTLSLDRALGIEKTGPGWALAALGVGARASVATVELARRRAPAEEDGRQAADDPELATVTT
jgi:putative oxidoreductase